MANRRRNGLGLSGLNIGAEYSREEQELLKLGEEYKKRHRLRYLGLIDMFRVCLEAGYRKDGEKIT